MPSHFYLSDKLTFLAKKLQQNIDSEAQNSPDLFPQPIVILPNRNLRRWIELYIANPENENAGILANWKFYFLESYLFEFYAESFAHKKPVIRETTIVDILMLLDQSKAEEFCVLKSYLNPGKLTTGLGRENQKLQLVNKLVDLFEDYERHRNQMITTWKKKDGDDQSYMDLAKLRGIEKLYLDQKSLYEKLSQLQKQNSFRLNEILELDIDTIAHKKGHIHLFGLSQISRLHLEILNHLHGAMNVHYYINHLNIPDTKSVQENPHWVLFSKEVQIPSNQYPENHLLPAFEMLHLMMTTNPKAQFFLKFSQPRSHSILQYMQSWILGYRDLNIPEMDASIQIISEPDKRKEIEAIYNSILNNLQLNSELKLDEIAILVPDMKSYRTTIESVFEAGIYNKTYHKLPYNLTDFASGNTSYFYRAVIILCRIFLQREYKRKDLIELINNPCFGFAHNLIPGRSRYESWIEKLNLFDNDLKDHPAQTWETGMNRLVLGQIMTNRFGNNMLSFNGLIPFETNSLEDDDQLPLFVKCLKSLDISIAEVSKMGAKPHRLIECIKNHIDKHIKIPDSMKNESSIETEIHNCLENYKMQKNINNSRIGIEGIYLILQGLEATVSGNSGQYLTGGITISALQPMRPVTFKIIYIPGLDSDSFPGKNDTSLFNLKNLSHEKGDVGFIGKNTLLFLETVFAASMKLILGFQSVDLKKDTKKILSPVITEFLEFIKLKLNRSEIDTLDLFLLKSNQNESGPDFYQSSIGFQIKNQEIIKNKGFSILQKAQSQKLVVEISNKAFSLFLKDPAKGILQGKYNQKFPFIKSQLKDANKGLFTAYAINKVIILCLEKYLQDSFSSKDVDIEKIFDEIYSQHTHAGDSPGLLYQDADRFHLLKWLTDFSQVAVEALDFKRKLHINFNSSSFRKHGKSSIKLKDFQGRLHFKLQLPVFQYQNNHLTLLQFKTNNQKKDYIDMFVQGLFFFYLRPKEFLFQSANDYKIECINIYKSKDQVKSDAIFFKLQRAQLEEYLEDQLSLLLSQEPDWLDFDLLSTIDPALTFRNFSSNVELKKELVMTHRYRAESNRRSDYWSELFTPDFPNNLLEIIHERWDIFSRAFDEK